MRRPRSQFVAIATVLSGLVSAVRPSIAATVEVEMRDNYFTPSTVTIAVGDTVTWVNRGANRHNTISNDLGLWGSDLLSTSQSFSFTFDLTGNFDYYCAPHLIDGMTATIVVGQPPAVRLLSPTNNAAFATGAAVTLTAEASDPDGTVSRVRLFDGATALGTNTGAVYNLVVSNLATGLHALTAVATDNVGLVATSAPVTIAVVDLRLLSISRTAGVSQLTYSTSPGLNYVLQSKPAVTSSWSPVLTNLASGSTTTNLHTNLPAAALYRVMLRPL